MKRLSCLYVWWFAYKCEENLCKNRVLVRKFLSLCAAWSNGFENLINVNFFRRKIYSLPERHASFKLATPEKMLLLTGKFRKYDEIPAIFFNLGAWSAAKTRECLLRFSALKLKFNLKPRLFSFASSGRNEKLQGTAYDKRYKRCDQQRNKQRQTIVCKAYSTYSKRRYETPT